MKIESINSQWLFNKAGFGVNPPLESGGFIRSGPGVSHPDIQFHFLKSLFADHGRKPDTFDVFQVVIIIMTFGVIINFFQTNIVPLRSQSKGSIVLQSNDPRQHPIIDLNYCSHEDDLPVFRKGIRFAREIFSQEAFDEFRGEEIAPGSNLQTDSHLDAFVREGVSFIIEFVN